MKKQEEITKLRNDYLHLSIAFTQALEEGKDWNELNEIRNKAKEIMNSIEQMEENGSTEKDA